MDENATKGSPLSDKEVIYEAMVQSALQSSTLAESLGLASNKIILSVKMSDVQDMVHVYQHFHVKGTQKG